MTTEQVTNTPESFADLLKARGDVPITVLRSVRDQIDGLLQLVDTMDEAFDLPPAPTEAEVAIAAALRAKYPDFKDKTDREVLAYFNVKVGGDDN